MAAETDSKAVGAATAVDDIDGAKLRTTSYRRKILVGAGAAALFVILALGLGLGLGLGLRKSHSNSLPPAAATGTASTAASSSSQPWRLAKDAYHLSMDWDLNAAPTTREYDFTVGEIQAAPDGVLRTMIVINAQFPSPLIQVNRGDRLLINVTNTLDEPTAIHWHGLFQNGTNWMDGTAGVTQCPIPPGRSFMYNFTVENQYGTYWYHSHYSSQYIDGMVGPFIVHAPEEAAIREKYDNDQVMLLQDWYHDMSTDLLPEYMSSGNENNEPVPDNGLIQGTNTFDCSLYSADSNYTCLDNSTKAAFNVTQDSRYRIRLINAGAFAEFQFSVDNHTLAVIEADATLVNSIDVHRLPIHVAQRYSVILTANQPSTNYFIRATMLTSCFATANPVLSPTTLALLSYTNSTTPPTTSADWSDALPANCKDLDPTTLVPSQIQSAPPADVLYVLTASFQIGAYALDRGYFNSTSWSPATVPTLNQATAALRNASLAPALHRPGPSTGFSPDQLVVAVPTTQVVDVLIANLDDGAHPFHLHGHDVWILAQSPSEGGYFPWASYAGIDTTNPLRRDTLTVPPFGWALVRFEADHPGLWALHCHIAWHMEAGLLMQFMTRTDLLGGVEVPKEVLGLCDV